MGACDFTTYAFGKTPTDAYGRAVEQAFYEDGHDPYNGTISTTDDFTEVELPKGIKLDEFIQLAWQLNENGEPEKPKRLRRGADEWERVAHQAEQRVYRVWTKLDTRGAETARKASRFGKWGCCTCVQVPAAQAAEAKKRAGLAGKQVNQYVFFGLAAM